MSVSEPRITATQLKFIKEYAIDFNGTEAYLRATGGDNRKSASVRASQLLKRPHIKAKLDEYVQEQLGPLEKDLIGNVNFWISVRDDPSARTSDRLKASEQLARYRSMFVERKEVDLTAQVVIKDDI